MNEIERLWTLGKASSKKPDFDGYVRISINKKRMLEHIYIWTSKFGPIPKGMEIHHKNHKRSDNRLENLQLLSISDHKKIHSGCYKNKKGIWIKPCNTCGKHKNIENNFYKKPKENTLNFECKECAILSNLLRRNKKKFKTAKLQIKILTQKIRENCKGKYDERN